MAEATGRDARGCAGKMRSRGDVLKVWKGLIPASGE